MALSVRELSAGGQFVILTNPPQSYTLGYELFARRDMLLRWHIAYEGADGTYADAHVIISECKGTHTIPTSTLVGIPISPNQEAESNIPPSVVFYVKYLSVPNKEYALCLS